jgi:hypothetical protein
MHDAICIPEANAIPVVFSGTQFGKPASLNPSLDTSEKNAQYHQTEHRVFKFPKSTLVIIRASQY